MVDIKVKEKLRNRVNRLVEQRMKETGAKDEKRVRIEVNKELRAKKKQNKASHNEEVDKIKAEVQTSMAGSDKKAVDKAVNKAIAKYFSKLKKSKHPQNILKQKADALIVDVNSQLWCPSDQGWWDEECQKRFDEVELLAAMWEINLLKAPQNFGKLYPAVSKKYFDFLAKKRFNSTKESEDKNTADKVKKSKSALQKKFEEMRAQNTDPKKTDNDILNEVLEEVNKKEKNMILKNLKKFWKPAHKPFFDKECNDAYENISDQATKMGFDLDTKAGDFKKFKTKNKEGCIKYFNLLESKRTDYNAKQKSKSKEKVQTSVKDESVDEKTTSSNKKTKFSGDGVEVSEESPKKKVKLETEADVEETIQQVEKRLMKERRKQAKLRSKAKKAENKTKQNGNVETTVKVDETSQEEKELKKEKRKLAKLAKKLKLKAKKEENIGAEETKENGNVNLETTDETPIKKPKKDKKSKDESVVDEISSVKKSKKKKSKD